MVAIAGAYVLVLVKAKKIDLFFGRYGLAARLGLGLLSVPIAIVGGCTWALLSCYGVTWPASIVLFITGSSCLAIGGQAFRAFGPKPPPDDVA